MRSLAVPIGVLAAPLLAAFFGFVGWNKAFAPLEELARHQVWTLALPEPAGRLIGWSELLLAAGLLAFLVPAGRKLASASAALLFLNQIAAAAVHAFRHESAAMLQNALLIVSLAVVAWTGWATAISEKDGKDL